MTKNILLAVLEKLAKISCQSNVKIVLAGGIAVSVFGRPRATYDIDGIVSLEEKKIKEFTELLKKNGFKFERGQAVRFIRGLPFITFYYPKQRIYVDLFVAKTKLQEEILKRARKIKFQKLNFYIISPEDLVLIKLQTGREKDIEDIREIILENKSRLNFTYLRKWAKRLGIEIFLRDELRSLGIK